MSTVERWDPLSIEELKTLFGSSARPYWVSGGWAIDLFLGRQTRAHEDLDISIARADQAHFQSLLSGWDLQVVDPPNSKILRTWKERERLDRPSYNIWSRKQVGGPWNIQIMLCDFENSEWLYRRNGDIRGPLDEFAWVREDGLKILSPVVQLLYKARNPREKDLQDLENCLPKLTPNQRQRLRELVLADSSKDHPWLTLI